MESQDGTEETPPEPPPEPKKRSRAWAVAAIGGTLLAGGLAALFALWPGSPASGSVPGDAAPAGTTAQEPPPQLPVIPAVGTGTLIQAGSVIDVAGKPVAGAAVTAELEMGPGVTSMPPTGLSLSPAVVAVAGADGSFQLVGVDAGRYRLRVEAPGIFTSEVRFVNVPSDALRLVVARKVAVRGAVVDPAGGPVAGLSVSLGGFGATGVHAATTDATGAFAFDELPEGIYQAWVAAGDRAAPAVRVERLGAGPFDPVTLTMAPAQIVRGRVVDSITGNGVAAAVRLMADGSEEPARFGRSSADGVFEIGGVPGGRWSAEAFAPGYTAVEALSFEVGGAFSPVISLRPGAVIEGVVVDPDGVPVRGAQISASGQGQGGRAINASAQVLAEISGRMTGQAQGLVVPGQRFIAHGELGVLEGPIPFPPPPGASAVRVASIVEEGDAQQAAPLPVPPELEPMFVSDDEGRFRVTGLVPGRYRVRAVHPDFADGQSDQLRLTAGKRIINVKVVMVPGVIVTGLVTDDHDEPVVGAQIIADTGAGDVAPEQAMLDSRLQAITGPDGRYRLGPVARDVTLRASAARHGTVTRKLALGKAGQQREERREDFVLPAADAVLRGRVRDPSGFAVRGASVTVVGDDAAGRSAVTDEAGRFVIANLAPGSYSVDLDHPKFPSARRKGHTGEDEVEMELPLGGGLAAIVRDAHNREPLVGVHVSARGPGRATAEAVTDEHGAFELAPLAAGKWSLSFELAGHVPGTGNVTIVAGDRPGEVTLHDQLFELERGATVAGVVRDGNGDRVRGAEVKVGSATGTSDELGRFRLVDVPTGNVVLEAKKGDARGRQKLELSPGDELVTLELTIR